MKDKSQEELVSYSEIESARFQCQVYRAKAFTYEQVCALRDFLQAEKPDLAIIRLAPELLAHFPILNQAGGLFVPADVLVRYEREALPFPDVLPASSLMMRAAKEVDLGAVDALTTAAFSNYVSHYHANPYIQDFDLTEAYHEWNRLHLHKGDQAGILLAEEAGESLGYLSWDIKEDTVSIDLNAVHPQHQGKQICSSLLAYACAFFHERSLKWVTQETQLNNTRVQRVWQRWGFVHTQSFITLHWLSDAQRNASLGQ